MKRVEATPETVHWGYFDARRAPVLTVAPGEAFELCTVSWDANDPAPPAEVAAATGPIFSDPREHGPGPHLVTGPVWVEGARPGDVLDVAIDDIRLTSAYGFNLAIPFAGTLFEDEPALVRTVIPIDREHGTAEVLPGLSIPTAPFFGILAVAPPPEWGRIDSRIPRVHGGNLDNKELRPGTHLFLPVWNEGALFSAGDGHGAQGDGEVNQTAIETSLDGTFRLRPRRDFHLDLPVAVTADHMITMAFHEDLDEAARRAVRCGIELLREHAGLSFHDAYRLCSLAADLRVTQLVNRNKGVHVMWPRSVLSGLRGRLPVLETS